MPRRLRLLSLVVIGAALLSTAAEAQGIAPTRHWTGQGVAPIFDGWDRNADGTFNMWFGYMNRNFEEIVEIPVGSENKFEPGVADRGQPTSFDVRRHKDVFRVIVPRDFPENGKLTWTLAIRGKAESVSGTLNQVWQIDRMRTTRGGNSENINSNTPPVVKAQPMSQTVASGASATLTVSATDDGLPERRTGETRRPVGMTAEWAKYRGPAVATFSPQKGPLSDGSAKATATFTSPGEYILLGVVDDGSGESAGNFGYHCCWTNVQVTVTVK